MQRTLLAGVVAVLWAAPARADTLTTSLEQPIYEISHTVDVQVAEGVATYRVRRTFMNPGKRADQAVLELDLPYGAAATGLRIRARNTWYEGELMERDQAAALYTAPTRVVVTGKLWSDPVRRELIATEPFSRASAAFVFGEDKHQDLSPAEQMRIAMFARAVSPVTSYVAAEPGTRPSTDGLTDGNLYGGLLGNEAGEINGGFGFGGNWPKPNLATLIDTRPCLRAHPQVGAWRVVLGVETTHEEVVDVTTKDTSPLAACLVEAAWGLRLEASAFTLPREQFVVELR